MTTGASHDEDGRLLITGGRVTLCEQLPADAARLAEVAPGRLVWIDGVPGEGTVIAARMTVEADAVGAHEPGWGLFALLRTEDGVALGGIGFHGPPDDDGTVEIGYDLARSARGAGWATEAVSLLSRWTLSLPEIRTVLALTEPGNLPSQRVLERAGFTRVADRDGQWAYELTAPAG